MDNIVYPNDDFDFLQLSLGNPTGLQGGAYMTKILYKDQPLYIQTPKSLTKQGFVKHPKKYYIELMFDNNDEKLFRWLENLEERCQKLIYEKGETWFQNQLEMNDIENAFAATIRPYKSCKNYLLRVNVKVNYQTNAPIVKIYNENQSSLTIDDVNTDTTIISILEIQGIKFSSRNFQIEMELKQVMTLNSEVFFDSCLIKPRTTIKEKEKEKEKEKCYEENKEETRIIVKENHTDTIEENESKHLETTIEENAIEENAIEENIYHELKEFDITDISTLETITLKKPNQVYYEIYKEARKKAKLAKKEAILAFLEAKNIKKTYMLENIDDSDSDNDSTFDNMSESEYSEEEEKIV